MKLHILVRLVGAVALLLPILSNQAQACPIDYTSSLPQFGAHAGTLASPISIPIVCDTSPVSYNSTRSSGGTWWDGTGYGNLGSISSNYAYHWGGGFWGGRLLVWGHFTWVI